MRKRGHDVRAIAEEPALDGLDDDSALQLATEEERILVTRNSRDFAPICRAWAEAGREHAGVVLIWRFSPRQHGEIIRGLERWTEEMPDQRSWRGLVVPL